MAEIRPFDEVMADLTTGREYIYQHATRSLQKAETVDRRELTPEQRLRLTVEMQAAMDARLLSSPEFMERVHDLMQQHKDELEGMTADEAIRHMTPKVRELLDGTYWESR